MTVEAAGEKHANTPPPPHPFDDTLIEKVLNPRFEMVGHDFTPMDEVDYKEIVGAERRHTFPADLLQKTKELRVLNLAVEGDPYRVCVRAGEVGPACSAECTPER